MIRTAPFTPEQESRFREIVREEVAIGVAATVGDKDRVLLSLNFLQREYDLGTAADLSPHERLVYLGKLAMDQSNAERGFKTDFAGKDSIR